MNELRQRCEVVPALPGARRAERQRATKHSRPQEGSSRETLRNPNGRSALL